MILKRGGRWRNKQIEQAILQDYGAAFQNNTIAKYLSFFINAGKVQSAPVTLPSGKTCDEYLWIEKVKRAKATCVSTPMRMSTEQLKAECLRIAKTYPEEHVQYQRIMEQYHNLESRERKVA